MNINSLITVLLVDDHQIVRQGILSYLETKEEIKVVGEAESGDEAVQLAKELVPDVVLMDLKMSGMDGVEATWRIRHVSPRTQVIILTSYHDDSHVFPAIKAGALSYLLKDINPEELVESIISASKGEAVVHPRIAEKLMNELRGKSHDPINPFVELSKREQDVLRLIADGLSNSKIAETLVISEKTVKGHVSNILGKLHLVDRTQAAVYAWKEGFVRREDTNQT